MAARSELPRVTDGEAGGDGVGQDGEVRGVERPSAAEAASIVEAALVSGRLVSLVGEVEVHAPDTGHVSRGVRHVLLKPDGSVVVHGQHGTTPDVALPGGAEPEVTAVDGTLGIAVGEEGARGRLRFERVDHVVTARVGSTSSDSGSGDRSVEGSDGHEALRERLLAEPERLEPGFRPLATERETSAGSVDVFGRDDAGRAVVVEIKAHRAGPAAVGQLDRYVSALVRDLHADAEVRGVLVAPSATDRTRRLLEERGFTFRAMSPDG